MTQQQKQKTTQAYRCMKGRIRSLIHDGYTVEEARDIAKDDQWSRSF